MKLLLTLVLFGVACCFALPECSEKELEKCYSYQFVNATTEKGLDIYCSEVQCFIEFGDRCGDPPPKYLRTGEYYKMLFGALCSETRPFRKKYLANKECLDEALLKTVLVCGIDRTHEIPLEELCRKLLVSKKCFEEAISKICSQDAVDVYRIDIPGYEYYDCPR